MKTERRALICSGVFVLMVAAFFVTKALMTPAHAIAVTQPSSTILINPSSDATFAPPPADVSATLTAEQAWAEYAQVNGGSTTIPSGAAVQLGLLTMPSGPADAPGAGNQPTSNGLAYLALNELAYGYSEPTPCPQSINPFVTTSPGASCVDWVFVDANTGKQIMETWQNVG